MDSILRCYLITLLVVSVLAAGLANPIYPRKTYVEINNQVPGNLTVRCKSKDDDLGIQELPPQGSWGFSFQPHLIVDNTLYFCSFARAGGQVQYFDIYKERRDEYRCNNCIWNVKPDGPCLRLDTYVCYPWNSETSLTLFL